MCTLHVFSGLQDQLLGQVVAKEKPHLEEAKNQLIIGNAKMKQELKEIEDEILYRLSSTEGNPVDNVELIQVLEASKIKAGEIKVWQWANFSLPCNLFQNMPLKFVSYHCLILY